MIDCVCDCRFPPSLPHPFPTAASEKLWRGSVQQNAMLCSNREEAGMANPFFTPLKVTKSEHTGLDMQAVRSQNLRSLTTGVLLRYKLDPAPAFAEAPQQSAPSKLISRVAL